MLLCLFSATLPRQTLAQSDLSRTRTIRTIDSQLPPSAPANTAKPNPVRSIDNDSWFPEVLSVLRTNQSLYFVPDVKPSGSYSSSRNWQRVLKGGRLRVRKGDASSDERTFIVQSIATNAVVLGVQGTLQQKRVPLLYLDR